jgi:hypothetical protein
MEKGKVAFYLVGFHHIHMCYYCLSISVRFKTQNYRPNFCRCFPVSILHFLVGFTPTGKPVVRLVILMILH